MTAQQHDEAFVNEALRAFGGQVYRTALASTRSPADAQDVVQDTFIALLEHSRPFHDREHLRAWLLRVAINRCRELHRSAWRSRVDRFDDACAQGLQTTAQTDPSGDLAALERHPVWTALEQLPEPFRVVIHMRYVEELSCDDIAKALGIPAVTVRTRLYRARRKLRALLGASDERFAAQLRMQKENNHG
ncbi:sigma-70 family RNA polymerase sigma factor [Collinsella tanakaei]|nr:sigma-70 family RNA polymerase sigma factor [Collinsella tanakaei]